MKSHLRQLAFASAVSLSGVLHAQEIANIPILKTPPRPATQLEFNGENFTVKVDPATATSKPVTGGFSNALQQQMRLAIEQAISPFFAIIYRAEAGFKGEETQLIGRDELAAAYISMMQSPALAWKPREGYEVQASWEKTDNLNQNLAYGHSEASTGKATAKFSEQTALSLSARREERSGYAGEETSQISAKASVEQAIENTPLRLVLGPGWEQITAADDSQVMRAFVDSAVIWKMDDWTTLSAGSNFGGSGWANLSDTHFFLVQHKVSAGAVVELKATVTESVANSPADGFSLSAQSTMALAEALSAGLGVRYRMNQNPAISQARGETFLLLTINGSF